MIRLPPSAIVLGPTDLKDLEIRQTQCQYVGRKEQIFLGRALAIQTVVRSSLQTDIRDRGDEESHSPDPPDTDLTNLTDDQDSCLSESRPPSPENATVGTQPSVPFKNGLQHVGSWERPAQQAGVGTTPSSPFSSSVML